MKNTIKTLALTTAVIGLATVIKRKKEQPAGTGHSTIYFGTIKPKNAQKGDIWFYPEKSSEIQLDRESSENINFTIMTDLK